MGCKYQYYKDETEAIPYLYCNIDNKRCIYSKRCDIVHRYISLDNQEECYKIMDEKEKDIPQGSYYIQAKRENQNGVYLYVDIDGNIYKINFADKNYDKDYIYITKENDVYIASSEPPKKARTYAKKS